MALDKSNFHLSKTRSFDDKDDSKVMGVALVDGEGEQVGGMEQPVPVRVEGGDTMLALLTELRIMNLHLASMTGENFTQEDL